MIRRILDWLFLQESPPWAPTCPEAQIELSMARRICWDYERFRYHLDRALLLERQHIARQPQPLPIDN
jgi:hypothetical protein